jgi:hypothetical protein
MQEQSEDYGALQRMICKMYEHEKYVTRFDAIMFAETYDLPADLSELISLLPPGRYTRVKLCDQLNSAIAGHGWGSFYGTVE